MERLIERCCGLDVHKAQVTVCVRLPGPRGTRVQQVRTFETTTRQLLALRDWLIEQKVTHVAMESTGVYWKPIYYLLEDAFTLLLVNPAHMKNVPGRKTDVQDCAWIAQLLEHGLLRASFVPPAPIRELRDLSRYRKTLIRERSREVNRMHKVLDDAGVKLASVATDILGVSGRAILDALVQGERDPEQLAKLARGRLRCKRSALLEALDGFFTAHHALLLRHALQHVDQLAAQIDTLSDEIERLLAPFAEAAARLDTIPGVNRRTVDVIIAEIGVDMSRFPTPGHLSSWAGLCPGQHESAGKRRSGRTRHGNGHLAAALTEAALAATRVKDGALAARYRRLKSRHGHKKAIVAVARAILELIHHLLTHGTTYIEVGAAYLDEHYRERAKTRSLKTLERLGFQVTLTAQEAA